MVTFFAAFYCEHFDLHNLLALPALAPLRRRAPSPSMLADRSRFSTPRGWSHRRCLEYFRMFLHLEQLGMAHPRLAARPRQSDSSPRALLGVSCSTLQKMLMLRSSSTLACHYRTDLLPPHFTAPRVLVGSPPTAARTRLTPSSPSTTPTETCKMSL